MNCFRLKGKILIIFFLSLFLLSCWKSDPNAERLKKYIKQVHHLEFQEETNYIVVSSFGCGGCIQNMMTLILSDTICEHKESLTYIVSGKIRKKYADTLRNKGFTVILDENSIIEKTLSGISNITIIRKRGNDIYSIESFKDVKALKTWYLNYPQ